MKKANFGMIGLAVMGENLALNIENKGFVVAVYNRTVPGIEQGVVDRFINGRGKEKNFIGCSTVKELTDHLEKPKNNDDGQGRSCGGRTDRTTHSLFRAR